jgi:hypothetical protein
MAHLAAIPDVGHRRWMLALLSRTALWSSGGRRAHQTTSCEKTAWLTGGYGGRDPVRTPLLADRGGRAGADRGWAWGIGGTRRRAPGERGLDRADRRAAPLRLSPRWRVGRQDRVCGRAAGRLRSCRSRPGRRVRGGVDGLRQRCAPRVRSADGRHLRNPHRASGQPRRRPCDVARLSLPDRARRRGRTGSRVRLSVLSRSSFRDPRTTGSFEDHV